MARKPAADAKGPREFFWFAMGLAPDDFELVLIPITLVIGVAFSLIWLLGAVFRSFFGD